MWQEILRFLKKQNRLTKVIFGTVVMIGLVLYSLLGIIYKNYNINKQSQDTLNEINRLSQDNLDQQSKILYYSTNAYAEKVLREKLGYQKEGERVYALPRTDPEREKLIAEQKKFQENQDNKPNPLKWYEFFFIRKDDTRTETEKNSGLTQPEQKTETPKPII